MTSAAQYWQRWGLGRLADRRLAAALLVWTLLVAASLAWNVRQVHESTTRIATAAARANLAKDIGFRSWVDSHGGVYVRPSPQSPPNPYLHLRTRDVTTTEGTVLTLINPAYALRQVQQHFNQDTGTRSHLTSLKLLNPLNQPDAWETQALHRLDAGANEVVEQSSLDGATYLRMMLPLKVTAGCLKCHGEQHYEIGQVRGGLAVAVSMAPYQSVSDLQTRELTLSHALIWLVGSLGLTLAVWRDRRSREQRAHDQTELRKLSLAMEQSPSAVLITGRDGAIEYVNTAFTRITGYGKDEVLGRNPRVLQSGKTTGDTYAHMWHTLRAGNVWTGELTNRRKDGGLYTTLVRISPVRGADDDAVTHYLAVQEDITERKASAERLHHLSNFDDLTKLPNRRLLSERLLKLAQASARSGARVAVLFVDLDHFKTINETRGYDIGDTLLRQVAQRLMQQVREGDTVARPGADEFVVLLPGLDASETDAAAQARMVAEKLQRALSLPYWIEQERFNLTPSIGIAVFVGSPEQVEDVLKHAEVAMHDAKTAGRNAIRFHDKAMQAALETRATLETELRSAIEQEAFVLYYQVQVDSLGQAQGAEALVRWNHPARGVLAPGHFIALAEESGLIVPLGHWVLRAACAQLSRWQSMATTRHLTLAINVSARQFHQRFFVDQVRLALQESGAKPAQLKLELTESMLLDNVDEAIARMQELRLMGVQFSLDDFGTGYSSLQYIKRLPLDQLKIDQSFVRDVADDANAAAIVQTVVAMSTALGLNVIAEGVETRRQRDFLDQHGCHSFQGYLFGKPLPVTEFEAALTAS